MHAKDSEPHAFLGLTGHLDLMTSEYQVIAAVMNVKSLTGVRQSCLL
jgi:hypothetical protein